MAISAKELMESVRLNPTSVQSKMVEMMEKSGPDTRLLVDPTSPFVMLLEAATAAYVATTEEAIALNRQLYPAAALTQEELYLHMADADYSTRFAQPSRGYFTFIISKEELLAKAVPVPGSGISKLTIPRHTSFTVSGYNFGINYPIDIRVMSHGGLQVVYDTSMQSTVEGIESNTVPWGIQNNNGVDYVVIEIPVWQFSHVVNYHGLNAITGFKNRFSFTDSFYHARVYHSTDAGNWEELYTTHTDQVYDITKPTAVLRVINNLLEVEIPQIYLTTGRLTNDIRVDIYSTKGKLDLNLQAYEATAFSAIWNTVEGELNREYSTPLNNLTTTAVFSGSSVVGGRAALTVTELRERVMRGTLDTRDIPITTAQLTDTFSDLGYGTVMNIDDITNRQFLATRALPAPTNGSVSSGAAAAIATLTFNIETLAQHKYVVDNGMRLSILPDMLYSNSSGVASVVSDTVIDALKTISNEDLVNNVNDNAYMYSPFMYVLDTNNNRFDARAYHLTAEVLGKSFVAENTTLELDVRTQSYSFTKIPNGYRLQLITRSGPAIKALRDDQLVVQASFTPTGDIEAAGLLGTLIGVNDDGERIYEFIIETNNDVDINNNLYITSFLMRDEINRPLPTSLLTDLNIIYTVNDYSISGGLESSIDQYRLDYLLPFGSKGVVQEKYSLRLGYSLQNLWNNSRSIVSELEYERYENNVPLTYETDIYETDIDGNIKFTVDSGTGALVYNKLHAAGDPVMSSEGVPVIKHMAGSVKLDQDGKPIALKPRKLARQVDLFMLEGVYQLVTDESSVEYRDTIADTVVDWLEDDLRSIENRLIEQTSIWFYPKSSLGNVTVLVNDAQEISIRADQFPYVRLYVNKTTYNNSSVRGAVLDGVVEIVNGVLEKTKVSVADMISLITATYPDSILGVEISNLGGKLNLNTLTITNDAQRLAMGKRAVALPNGKMGLVDGITVEFVKHSDV